MIRRLLGLLAIALAVPAYADMHQPKQATKPADPVALVNRAVEALGGAQALTAVSAVRTTAFQRHWEPMQGPVPVGEGRYGGDSNYVEIRNFAQNAVRKQWDRNLVAPAPRKYAYTEIVADGAGIVLGVNTSARTAQSLESKPPAHTMSAARLAVEQREYRRCSPVLLLEMQRNPKAVSAMPAQRVGDAMLPAARYRAPEYDFIVLFDPATGLPARVRTIDADAMFGDAPFDLALSDWRTVNGVRFPFREHLTIDGRDVAINEVRELQVNPAIAAGAFDIPQPMRAFAGTRPATIPYQWMIRRELWGGLLDSNAIHFDSQALKGLSLREIAPGVAQTVGSTHNSLVIEFPQFLVVLDAPIGETYSRETIRLARELYRNKPIRYVMLTHHHLDHSSGIRTYAAEGATVVVGAGLSGHFDRVLRAPMKSVPDQLAKNPRAPRILEVFDQHTIRGGDREVRIFLTRSSHSNGTLTAYLPGPRMFYVTDLWSPGRDAPGERLTPGQNEVVAAVRDHGIAVDMVVGGHGSFAPFALIEKLAAR